MTVRHMSYASLSGQKMFRMYYIGGRPACMGGAWGYPYVAISPLQAQCSAHGGAYAWGVEVVGGSVDGGWRHGGLCLVGRGRVPLGGRREPCVAHDVVLLLVSRATSAPRDAPRFQGSSRTAFGRLAFLGLGRGRGHKGGGGNGDGAVRRVLALGGRGATSARILDVGNVPSSAELGAAATLPAGLTLTRTDVHPRPYVGRGERVWMSSRVGRMGLLGRCSHVVACGV